MKTVSRMNKNTYTVKKSHFKYPLVFFHQIKLDENIYYVKRARFEDLSKYWHILLFDSQ